jgi:hypothetical protein
MSVELPPPIWCMIMDELLGFSPRCPAIRCSQYLNYALVSRFWWHYWIGRVELTLPSNMDTIHTTLQSYDHNSTKFTRDGIYDTRNPHCVACCIEGSHLHTGMGRQFHIPGFQNLRHLSLTVSPYLDEDHLKKLELLCFDRLQSANITLTDVRLSADDRSCLFDNSSRLLRLLRSIVPRNLNYLEVFLYFYEPFEIHRLAEEEHWAEKGNLDEEGNPDDGTDQGPPRKLVGTRRKCDDLLVSLLSEWWSANLSTLGFYIDMYTSQELLSKVKELVQSGSCRLRSLSFHAGYGRKMVRQQLQSVLSHCNGLDELTLWGMWLREYPQVTRLTLRESRLPPDFDDCSEAETKELWATITNNPKLRILTIDRPAWGSPTARSEPSLPNISCLRLESLILNLHFGRKSYGRRVISEILSKCKGITSLEVYGGRGISISRNKPWNRLPIPHSLHSLFIGLPDNGHAILFREAVYPLLCGIYPSLQALVTSVPGTFKCWPFDDVHATIRAIASNCQRLKTIEMRYGSSGMQQNALAFLLKSFPDGELFCEAVGKSHPYTCIVNLESFREAMGMSSIPRRFGILRS